MSREQWPALRELFDALCGLPAEHRAARIDASGLDAPSRALLMAMLDADGSAALRDDAVAQAPAVVAALADDERRDTRVGAWRIDALIGAGGMGRVYRAHREDGRYEGVAAIKFVAEAANPEFFVHERQVLARLTHPAIARLLDAGEDERGLPYLVMEYVDGVPIDAHCRDTAADARARIACIATAARAIAHAHAQSVLHRDLKPANLLIDRAGQLKVLDFGVAKLLDRPRQDPQHTTARYFTLRYAAPEQIAGEGTSTAVDLYALAVVLYELLTGVHPAATADRAERGVVERVLAGELTPLRRALGRGRTLDLSAPRLRDLEAVLDKALARAPEARYASAAEFADELQRVLDDRPVLARPPGAAEMAARYARRRPLAVALGALAVVALAVFAGLAVWQGFEAARERDVARREAARAEHIARFLTGLFEGAQPLRNRGKDPSARELLDQGREQLQREADLEPELRAALRVVIADSYRSLGHYAEAEALLQDALSATAADAPQRAPWLLQLGRVHNFQARWADAERVLRDALTLDAARADGLLVAGLQRQLAVSLLNQGRAADAEAAALAARAALQALPTAATRERVDTEMLLATLAYGRNDFPAALAAYQGIVAAQRGGSAADQHGLVTALNNLAAIELRIDRIEDAVVHYREAIERARTQYGASNREVALPLLGLGSALRALGEFDAARAALAESRDIYLQWSGADHPETAYARLLLAELTWLEGGAAAARELAAGSADVLAAENPTSTKACRAALLELALLDAGATPSQRQQGAIACLSAETTPAALRLLARHVAARRGDADAAAIAELAREAAQLQPRDAALRAALERDARNLP
jgi:serine/threonine-protein kinase